MGLILDLLESMNKEYRKQVDMRTDMIVKNFNYFNSLPRETKLTIYEQALKNKSRD